MKRLLFTLVLLLQISSVAYAQPDANDYSWLSHIRTDHPRMFLTKEDIPQIKHTASTFEQPYCAMLKRRIGRIIDKPVELVDLLVLSGEKNKNDRYGDHAAESAILWLVTGEQKYLDFAKYLINTMIDYYHLRIANDLNINWYAFSQIGTLCAYDWIYNDLPAEERRVMGERLYHALYNIAWHGQGFRERRYRENPSNPKNTGFYGSSVLPWYVGLAFYGEGYDDKACERMLRKGYADHCKMSSYRAELLGKNGGCSSGPVGYGLGYYPYAEYDFIHTFRSGTGIDITPKMKYMVGYLNYMDWCRLPENREFGVGDSHHTNNKLPYNIATHIREIADLFGRNNPELINWVSEFISLYKTKRYPSRMSFLPLLHRLQFESDDVVERRTTTATQSATYFESLGQIIMRTGRGDNDTYALFMTERSNHKHQHYDLNNFIIYKNGYRAIDSGTRPQPGLHLPQYYGRTVAHNCITVRMPDEELPAYWGTPAPGEGKKGTPPNDGGQCRCEAKLLALEDTAEYVYIASDATEAYHADKVDKVVREFVWIKPDVFVVYDRVVSDKAEYPKRWLYHIASEPVANGKMEFSESSQGGKSICRTLLPKDAKLEFVGGEGKQFWSDGKNWTIPEIHRKSLPNTNPLFGQWRVEVTPKKAATQDHFLHIIQVGDESLQTLPRTKTVDKPDCVILSFGYEGKAYTLTFDKRRDYGCEIKVK